MTRYVVLRQAEAGGYELLAGEVEAYGDLDAVRRAVRELPKEERSGEFVAVPSRSFKTRKLLVETVQKELWT